MNIEERLLRISVATNVTDTLIKSITLAIIAVSIMMILILSALIIAVIADLLMLPAILSMLDKAKRK